MCVVLFYRVFLVFLHGFIIFFKLLYNGFGQSVTVLCGSTESFTMVL